MDRENLKAETDLSSYNVPSDTTISKDVSFKSTKVTPRYYKQAYRTEWESMPDFRGWLKGVPGEPTRAYCTFCKKSLHAHRLSLLKHTCTLKHTKAAQAMFNLQVQRENPPKEVVPEDLKSGAKETMQSKGNTSENQAKPSKESSKSCEDKTPNKKTEGPEMKQQKNTSTEAFEEHEERESETSEETDETNRTPPPGTEESEFQGPPKKKYSRPDTTQLPIPPSGPLSTYVLDTTKGIPIAGLHVSLYKLVDGRWTFISEGQTNPDGHYNGFIQKPDFVAGRYKLHFDVDRYFELRKVETFYPFIEIAFDVKSPNDNYHVPLLLSPFGYTTCRGS